MHLQEKCSVPYVVDDEAGVFMHSPKDVMRIALEWLSGKPDELTEMLDNAHNLA